MHDCLWVHVKLLLRNSNLYIICLLTSYFYLLPLPLGLTMTALFTESVQFSVCTLVYQCWSFRPGIKWVDLLFLDYEIL